MGNTHLQTSSLSNPSFFPSSFFTVLLSVVEVVVVEGCLSLSLSHSLTYCWTDCQPSVGWRRRLSWWLAHCCTGQPHFQPHSQPPSSFDTQSSSAVVVTLTLTLFPSLIRGETGDYVIEREREKASREWFAAAFSFGSVGERRRPPLAYTSSFPRKLTTYWHDSLLHKQSGRMRPTLR